MVPAKALAREARATRCVTRMPPSQGSRAFPFAPVFTNAFCLYMGCPRNTKRRIPNVECASAMQKRPSALLLPKPTNLDHALFRTMQVNRRLLLSVMLGKDYSIGFGNITYYMNPPPPSPQPPCPQQFAQNLPREAAQGGPSRTYNRCAPNDTPEITPPHDRSDANSNHPNRTATQQKQQRRSIFDRSTCSL